MDTTKTINFETQVDMSIVEAKVLEFIVSEFIGVSGTATARNPQDLQGGTGRFWIPELGEVQTYTQANKNDEPDQPSLGEDEVQLNILEKSTYEIETMDFSGLIMAGAIEANIAKNLSLPMIAVLDAKLIDILIKQAITNGGGPVASTTPGYIVNDKFSTTRDEADFKNTYFDISDLASNLEGTVDKQVMGLNKVEVISMGNLRFMPRVLAFLKSGNIGSEQLQSGILQTADGNHITKHPFFGKNFSTKFPYHKNLVFENFDKIELLTWHTEAVAMPFALRGQMWGQIDPNSGNMKYGIKYKYGIKVLKGREHLVRAVFNVDPTPPTPIKNTIHNHKKITSRDIK